jgi:hypothetical protein
MCDVASISLADSKYYESVRKHFYYASIGKSDMMNPNRAHDPTNPVTAMMLGSMINGAGVS